MRSIIRKSLDTSKNLKNTRKYVTETQNTSKTVDKLEVEHHSKMYKHWWDLNGEMKALHSMNPLRVQFIRDGLGNVGHKEATPSLPLQGLKILDVGCGGGILSEPLARIGANVTGIDASSKLIETAKEHAALDKNLCERLNYINTTVEDHVQSNSNAYDAVVASEILEHVSNQNSFLKYCTDLSKPGGSIFVTTLNKTFLSYAGAILAAEYLLKIVPVGTHSYDKFISPESTRSILEEHGCQTKLVHGMTYNPLTNQWHWIQSTAVNYAIHTKKLSPPTPS